MTSLRAPSRVMISRSRNTEALRASRSRRPILEAMECRTMLEAGSIQFSTAAFSVADSAGTVPIVMTRTGGSTGAVSVKLATSDGTAVAGTDYDALSGSVSFPDGVTTEQGEPDRPARPGRQPSRPDGEPDVEQPLGRCHARQSRVGSADHHPRRDSGRPRWEFRHKRPGDPPTRPAERECLCIPGIACLDRLGRVVLWRIAL